MKLSELSIADLKALSDVLLLTIEGAQEKGGNAELVISLKAKTTKIFDEILSRLGTIHFD